MEPEHVIKRPIILTEAASTWSERGKFFFEVDRRANKIQIRDAVQKLFKVTVTDVNTMIVRGKERRMGRGYARYPNWKKAIVTLKPGDSIQFMETTEAPSDDAGSDETTSTSKELGPRNYHGTEEI